MALFPAHEASDERAPGRNNRPLRASSDIANSVAEARVAYAARRPRSQALHEQARAVMPGGNTRSVLSYGPFPTAMARGEGCRLWDVDGHEYLDLCGEYTAGLFGHSEARIQAAIVAALGRGLNLSAVGEAEVELARILCARFPSMELVRFANSGTEANLLALTAARAFTGRPKVLAFRGGYHGGVLPEPWCADRIGSGLGLTGRRWASKARSGASLLRQPTPAAPQAASVRHAGTIT